MVDVDTFLTILYVMVDDFCKASLPPESRPGPLAALSRSEVVTLAMFGQWQGFGSERGFYRFAQRHLRTAFPPLPGWMPISTGEVSASFWSSLGVEPGKATTAVRPVPPTP